MAPAAPPTTRMAGYALAALLRKMADDVEIEHVFEGTIMFHAAPREGYYEVALKYRNFNAS